MTEYEAAYKSGHRRQGQRVLLLAFELIKKNVHRVPFALKLCATVIHSENTGVQEALDRVLKTLKKRLVNYFAINTPLSKELQKKRLE